MILASISAFESIDNNYESIARVLGLNNTQVFFKISIPLAKKGILLGFIMTWIRAVGELGATLMIAYNPHTISIQIFEDNTIGGLRQTVPEIILVLFLTVVVIITYSIITRKYEKQSTDIPN